ncbi:hypothetical protein SBOR_4637 [Sclerotinia borealis F-4128]|uniref:Uncharacterized protein n=1 Tax=Sclerotinia borealis (strain F-4128) TaxID=1432307 RepID=W9CE29_SCLBF|nr:hypothetical protein SBOR_4637 [Sclerotinia borealis F-4128]
MSTAVAMAPSPVPHDRSSYIDIAPSKPSNSPPAQRIPTSAIANVTTAAQRTGSGSPRSTLAKPSPIASRNGAPPKIIVKKEPSSPEITASSRHRPRKLDLTKNTSSINPGTGRLTASQLTGRGAESGGLGIQDVGFACLSPGFQTQDPTMREQLQRSLSVRDQQRHIIESRLQQTAKPGDAPMESAKERELSGLPAKTPGTSRRKAPPGLSIVAPSHEQFADERVIQSAPMHHSFPGRHQPQPLTRHVANQPSNLSNTSHIHHVPATQTTNRLPPISDVFAGEGLGAHRESPRANLYQNSIPNSNSSHSNSSHSNSRPGFPSPGHAPHPPASAGHQRPREYRSAEDAQADLAGGRPELLPKLVHYGNHQPPTPPSPTNFNARPSEAGRNSGRRRPRAEYEEGASPPLGQGPPTSRRSGPFGEGRDSPMTTQKKKEEFMRICARAWDLFHS